MASSRRRRSAKNKTSAPAPAKGSPPLQDNLGMAFRAQMLGLKAGLGEPPSQGVLECTRPAFFDYSPVTHKYLYNPANKQSCGLGKQDGWGTSPPDQERGPGVDNCVEVQDSHGLEDQVFQACEDNAKEAWWLPYVLQQSTCHEVVENALKENGLKSPDLPKVDLGTPYDNVMQDSSRTYWELEQQILQLYGVPSI